MNDPIGRAIMLFFAWGVASLGVTFFASTVFFVFEGPWWLFAIFLWFDVTWILLARFAWMIWRGMK